MPRDIKITIPPALALAVLAMFLEAQVRREAEKTEKVRTA